MSCKKTVADTYTHLRGEKALTEVLDYSITYAKTFALVSPTDTINTSTWSISSNATIDSDSDDGTIATVWVSGGTKIGNLIRLVNTIVTVGGRTHVRVLILKVVNRLAEIPAT